MRMRLGVFATALFIALQPATAFPAEVVQTLDNNITASVYSVKKTKHYVAVEIGFTNPTENYLEFTPTEIYLDDAASYSKAPLTTAELQNIEAKRPDASIFPGLLAVGLGIATLGTGIYGESGATKALGVAALGAGGAYIATKAIQNHAQANRLIRFENNDITSLKKLPPGMTLGGFIFFPAAKQPKSVTIVARAKSGKYERLVFDIGNVKGAPRIRDRRSHRKDR